MLASNLTVELARQDEAGFNEVFAMLIALHGDVGVVPMDRKKYAEGCWSVLGEGMTFVAREGGEPVGTLGLIEATWWYAPDHCRFLQDRWFYVKPEHRGNAGMKLLRAARDLGYQKDRIVYVWNTNPDKRQKAFPFGVEAQRLGYVPYGYNLRLDASRRKVTG
jgi:GNAT superfamily N-acetyltransferase